MGGWFNEEIFQMKTPFIKGIGWMSCFRGEAKQNWLRKIQYFFNLRHGFHTEDIDKFSEHFLKQTNVQNIFLKMLQTHQERGGRKNICHLISEVLLGSVLKG